MCHLTRALSRELNHATSWPGIAHVCARHGHGLRPTRVHFPASPLAQREDKDLPDEKDSHKIKYLISCSWGERIFFLSLLRSLPAFPDEKIAMDGRICTCEKGGASWLQGKVDVAHDDCLQGPEFCSNETSRGQLSSGHIRMSGELLSSHFDFGGHLQLISSRRSPSPFPQCCTLNFFLSFSM